jgi:hypothetical protein
MDFLIWNEYGIKYIVLWKRDIAERETEIKE